LDRWHSHKQWYAGKLPFDARYLPLYADHVARVLGALRGKSRRCLVLDLDNTLWGGVIGDDGLEGIVIGQGDAAGEAYLDVQRMALALNERGIVLAVSSKNDEAIARRPFREHSEMLLREDRIAIFQANWADKASNVAAIAKELNLGLDAMVLVDDNPAERELVRSTFPDVAVPELPEDPSQYARYIAAAGYFEAASFSQDDSNRIRSYRADARRIEIRDAAADLDSYLTALDMRIAFRPFDAANRSRIASLINKSNQYNLTTRRYGEIDVAGFEIDPKIFTLQVRLEDRFGDNGTISLVICRATGPNQWEIDTWVMSCRVLGRRVEHAVLNEILEHARRRGIETIVGSFVPSGRNELVRDHYSRLGFTLLERDAAGPSQWTIQTHGTVRDAPFTVRRDGFSEDYLGPDSSRNSINPKSV
jgi:FkbH-like protein